MFRRIEGCNVKEFAKNSKNIILKYKYQLLTFCAAFIPKAVLCFFALPVGTLSDEVATMSSAAYLAGYDWSAVVSHAGYYGQGFTWLFSPIFMITDNPFIIYRSILLICTLVQSIPSLICYHILENYFDVKDKKILCLISIACSYMVVTRGMVMFNEHPMILLSWLFPLVILKLFNEKNKQARYFVYLGLLILYGLTLHTRAITYFIALMVMLLLMSLIYRRSYRWMAYAAVGGGIAYFASKLLINAVQKSIWLVEDGGTLRNAEINWSLKEQLVQLFNPENWQAWLNIVLGQINTITVITGGILLLAMFVCCKLLCRIIKNRKGFIQTGSADLFVRALPLLIFFVSCIGITISGQSLSWLKGASEAIAQGFDNNNYSTKAFGYVRYFGPYVGPVFMITLVYLYKKREDALKLFKYVLGGIIMLQIYWNACVVPYIYHSEHPGAVEAYMPFSFYNVDKPMRLLAILPASIVVLVIFIVIWRCIKNKKYTAAYGVVCLLLIYQYIFSGIEWDLRFEKVFYSYADSGYKLIKDIEDEVELPDKIYSVDARGMEDHQTYYEYQFMLNRYTIIPEKPADDVDEAVLFINYPPKLYQWVLEGYMFIDLDNDEFLLVKGEGLQEQFMDAGVELRTE